MRTLVLVSAALLGACIGSFLNVCIYRLPRRCLRLWSPSTSFCPRCRRALLWHENVPLIGYLTLGGRCRGCRERISVRYPIVELLTALLFVYLAHRYWLPGQWGAAITLAILGAALIVCTGVDSDWRVIPRQIDIPGFLLAPVAAFVAPYPFLERERLWYWLGAPDLPEALVPLAGPYSTNLRMALASVFGAVLGALVIAVIRWAGTRIFPTAKARRHAQTSAMGFDDIRFMAMIGGFSGWQGVAWTIFASSILSSLFGVGKKLITKGDSYMPYGPALAFAGAIFIYTPEVVVALARLRG